MFDRMNPREQKLVKLLLVLTPVLVLPLGAIYLWTSLGDKRTRVTSLEKVKSDLELNQMRWVKAEQRRTEFRRLSLPADVDAARSAYQNWLLTTSTSIFGERSATVRHVSDVPRRHLDFDVYTESDFTLTTRGTLDQLTSFLSEFYQLDCLHRISRMTVAPIVDPQTQKPGKLLALRMDISAIAVAGAEDRPDLKTPVETLEFDLAGADPEDLKNWRDDVLRRNVFGLPNNTPTLTRAGTRRFRQGDRLELSISARDVDDQDTLEFELVDSPMSGVKLESDRGGSAKLVLPQDLAIGTYKFTVAVSDDGLPSKRDQQEYVIEVEEAPEPPMPRAPEEPFDPAIATYVTGVVMNREGQRYVFIDVKPEGRTLRLTEGEKFEVGTVSGSVIELTNGRATLEINGEPIDFRPGQVLIKESASRSDSSRSDSGAGGSSRSGSSRSTLSEVEFDEAELEAMDGETFKADEEADTEVEAPANETEPAPGRGRTRD